MRKYLSFLSMALTMSVVNAQTVASYELDASEATGKVQTIVDAVNKNNVTIININYPASMNAVAYMLDDNLEPLLNGVAINLNETVYGTEQEPTIEVVLQNGSTDSSSVNQSSQDFMEYTTPADHGFYGELYQ